MRRIKWCVRIWRRGWRRAGGLAAGADWVVDPVPGYVERDLRKFLVCGILAHGFARACCEKCGQDFLVAYSCKGRGVCPGCNTRRMVETAAHMVEHVFPAVSVRQWVVVFPKRLRYFLDRDADCLKRVLGLFERRGLLSSETVGVMQGWGHRGGFSVHAGVRVAAQDRVGHYSCARITTEAVTSKNFFFSAASPRLFSLLR